MLKRNIFVEILHEESNGILEYYVWWKTIFSCFFKIIICFYIIFTYEMNNVFFYISCTFFLKMSQGRLDIFPIIKKKQTYDIAAWATIEKYIIYLWESIELTRVSSFVCEIIKYITLETLNILLSFWKFFFTYKMKSRVLFLIMIYLSSLGDSESKLRFRWQNKNDWFAPILNETKKLLKPRQIHIYFQGNSRTDSVNTNHLIGSLMREFPVLSVNTSLQTYRGTNIQVYLHRQKDQYPITSILNLLIMFYSKPNGKKNTFHEYLKQLLDRIRDRRIADRLPRAKTLVIVFNAECKDTKMLNNYVFAQLRNAWRERKFLDLSLVPICKNSKDIRPDLFYHHPFINRNIKMPLNSSNQLFPNKLRNLNRYKFVLGVEDNNYNKESNYRRENMEALTPADYIFVKDYFAQSLNLQVQVSEVKKADKQFFTTKVILKFF